MDNGPTLWTTLLSSVREIYETEAIVAGGAVRDYNMDKPVKDIDIFLNTDADTLLDRTPELGFGPYSHVYEQKKAYDRQIIEDVINFQVLGHDVQLIAKKMDDLNPASIFECFDFGFCQAAFDADNGLVYSPAYHLDKQSGTCTLLTNDENWEKSYKRYLKWLDKYPDLKLIDLSNQERADEWVHIQKAVKKRNKKSTAPLFRRGDLFFPPLAPIDMPNLEDNND
jgi:hypothetical protein